jgi:hypothetical protein
MTTTSSKPTTAAQTATRIEASAEKRAEHARSIGREIGKLAVNVYERQVAGFAAFEKDVAKIAPEGWAKSALTLSAGLVEEVGSAYVKTARTVLR